MGVERVKLKIFGGRRDVDYFAIEVEPTLSLKDLRIAPTYSTAFQGPPHSIQVERKV